MNIENDLKKDGIVVTKPVDTLTVTLLAKYIAEKIVSAFPFYELKYKDLFIKVSRLSMYFATMPAGMAEATYFYKNSSIYFRDGLSLEDMQKYAIHEFIHHLQELKDKKNILYRLGLCDFTGFKVYGMGLNEAAVQTITAKILKNEIDTVKYYDIELPTNSPSCYPLLCNLMTQLIYITGESVLFDSTIHGNDKFKNKLIYLCGERNFYKIQDAFDKILNTEEKLIEISDILQQESLEENKIVKLSNQMIKYKKLITNTFIQTQNLIITSYFDHRFEEITNISHIEDFRKSLYSYKDLIGTTDTYTYFNDYYVNTMAKLEEKETILNHQTYLIPYKKSLLQIAWSKCLALIQNLHSPMFNRDVD